MFELTFVSHSKTFWPRTLKKNRKNNNFVVKYRKNNILYVYNVSLLFLLSVCLYIRAAFDNITKLFFNLMAFQYYKLFMLTFYHLILIFLYQYLKILVWNYLFYHFFVSIWRLTACYRWQLRSRRARRRTLPSWTVSWSTPCTSSTARPKTARNAESTYSKTKQKQISLGNIHCLCRCKT